MPIIVASMQWDDVRLFLALHRVRTVGAAARALGADPSTVSRRLVALEEALAATLFDRGRRGSPRPRLRSVSYPLPRKSRRR